MDIDVIIKNGKLVYPEKTVTADMVICGGKIKKVGKGISGQARTTIDARGCFVLPGLIDPHIHPLYADDFKQASISAAFGGVTTVMHYISVKPGWRLLRVIKQSLVKASQQSVLDFALHASMFDTINQLKEIPAATQLGVKSFKMFTAYARLGWMTDDYALARAMDIIAANNAMACVHAESGMAIDYLEDRLLAQHKDLREYFLETSPALLDKAAIFRTLCLAKITGCALYLPHISSKKALEALLLAREEGINHYAEVCPQYLVFTWQELKQQGALGKIRPPVKNHEDRQALWQAMQQGTIHTIGSDHAPKHKQKDDDFSKAPYGAPGTETILPLLWEYGVNKKRITANMIVKLACENPARIFGLSPQKGRLESGADADIVIFDPNQEWIIKQENQHSNAPYTLYEGQRCKGRVKKVLARGKLLVDGENFLGKPGQGEFLKTEIDRELS